MQVSVARVQFQSVPLIAVAVRPVGSESVTDTWPEVGSGPWLETAML